jgi:predicted extracellular nuclease
VITHLTGVIDYGPINSDTDIRHYRLQPTGPVTISRVNVRSTAPDLVGGSIRVASFNVLNYFNGNGSGGGFPTSRGADTLAEFNRQRNKIIPAIVALNADVVGLMEIEKDGTDALSAIQDLVNGLNVATSAGTYAFVTEPAPGTDEIKVAMIYQPARVTPQGAALNHQVTTNPNYNPLFDRPPLAQRFRTPGGEEFFVIVNHFKSKGSCPGSGVDTDQGDGQGCWNAKRTAQANGLLDWITTLQATDPDVIVIGDLNAYGVEDPINTLVAGGLINQALRVPAATRYSYVFDGQAGYLDQALTTASLDAHVTGVTYWHINADEPSFGSRSGVDRVGLRLYAHADSGRGRHSYARHTADDQLWRESDVYHHARHWLSHHRRGRGRHVDRCGERVHVHQRHRQSHHHGGVCHQHLYP